MHQEHQASYWRESVAQPHQRKLGAADLGSAFSARDSSPDVDCRQEERSRIGRELHDATAQTLVSLQLQIIYLRQMFDDPRFHDKLGEVQSTIDDLHEEIRSICSLGDLPSLERGKLPAALQLMTARFADLTGLDIHFATSGAYGGLTHQSVGSPGTELEFAL